MKKPAIKKAPRLKSFPVVAAPEYTGVIMVAAWELMKVTNILTGGPTDPKVQSMRELVQPAYNKIAELLSGLLGKKVPAGKLYDLEIAIFPVHGHFRVSFTHDDGSHEIGQAYRLDFLNPTRQTVFQLNLKKHNGLDGAMKEAKKL
jgi:hypothetical protein